MMNARMLAHRQRRWREGAGPRGSWLNATGPLVSGMDARRCHRIVHPPQHRDARLASQVSPLRAAGCAAGYDVAAAATASPRVVPTRGMFLGPGLPLSRRSACRGKHKRGARRLLILLHPGLRLPRVDASRRRRERVSPSSASRHLPSTPLGPSTVPTGAHPERTRAVSGCIRSKAATHAIGSVRECAAPECRFRRAWYVVPRSAR